MKINPEMESKFQRLTAYRKNGAADYGLVMPESELRQCRGGRQLLAAIKRARRDQQRTEKLFFEAGRAASEQMNELMSRLISERSSSQSAASQPPSP